MRIPYSVFRIPYYSVFRIPYSVYYSVFRISRAQYGITDTELRIYADPRVEGTTM